MRTSPVRGGRRQILPQKPNRKIPIGNLVKLLLFVAAVSFTIGRAAAVFIVERDSLEASESEISLDMDLGDDEYSVLRDEYPEGVRVISATRTKERGRGWKTLFSAEELDCLALNIFYEAGVEDYVGKIAVAQVTYNRLVTGIWGDNVCNVVYHQAQFSWTLKDDIPLPTGPSWTASYQAAQDFAKGIRLPEIEGVLHYHADYANPEAVYWASEEFYVSTVGRHIFYKGIQP